MKNYTFIFLMKSPEGGSLVERQATFAAKDSFDAFRHFNEFARELKRPITKLKEVKEA